jgi:MFS family permease
MSPEARRTAFVVYALVFYTGALEVAIVPLLPLYSQEFDLSTVEAGLLLAAVNVAVMVLSIPLGRLSDTIGARRTTVAAAVIYALAAVGQALSSSYELLVLSWAIFGVGVAIVASGSLAWLSDSLPDDKRARALGGVATISGVGIIAGPLFGGVVVESLGRKTSFLLAAAAVGLIAVLAQRSTSETTGRSPLISLSSTLLAVRTEPMVGGGVALVGLLGLVFGVVSVLIPLRLAENGLSEAEIGLVFSATAAIFIAVSWTVARGGARHVTLQIAAALGFAQAAALVIPIASLSTLALVAFLGHSSTDLGDFVDDRIPADLGRSASCGSRTRGDLRPSQPRMGSCRRSRSTTWLNARPQPRGALGLWRAFSLLLRCRGAARQVLTTRRFARLDEANRRRRRAGSSELRSRYTPHPRARKRAGTTKPPPTTPSAGRR